ncbi:MAG: ShlB/FhaC/HecB family hemolysin secretion/activation protein [Sedimentisphaerales bacterium]|nr:ShlB/FhaC/HecB family hemolysin secretion/activation protein [Sedimentisphaerales bacterium]
MQKLKNRKAIIRTAVICAAFAVCAVWAIEPSAMYRPTETRAKLDEQKRLEQEAKKHVEVAKNAMTEIEAAQIPLPADTGQRWSIKEIRISGNKLIATAELLKSLPLIYNTSDMPIKKAASQSLYDLREIRRIAIAPGQPREISARAIQGFTQYLLSAYEAKHFAGIYVYVPSDAMAAGKELSQGILPINIIEAPVTQVGVKSYDIARKEKEKGYLRHSAVKAWSPVEPNSVANRKKLDDFVNLLNLNPDRYVSAVVSKGDEPNSLALEYDIIEANPWHWFAQIDNSGIKSQQWTPRVGVINTDLFGFDDIFTAMYQAKPDSTFDENYSVYGSYDFPLLGPRLRLTLFSGYSQSDITPDGQNINFLGNGYFYGGKLRYNLFQADKWFFDLTSSFSYERSKSTPSLFPEFLASNVYMKIVGYGVDIHRRNDMQDTSLIIDRVQNVGGSDQEEYSLARVGAEKYFAIDTLAVSHKQYLDPNKVQNLIGTLKYIYPEDRLIPAKMTIFGGMYTVRGYEEDGIVADGGILTSLQYEFDLVRYGATKNVAKNTQPQTNEKKPWLRRLAPLAFVDYGWAKIKNPEAGEDNSETLLSVGPGITADIGEHLTGVLYWGIAMKTTSETEAGASRLNVGVLARW